MLNIDLSGAHRSLPHDGHEAKFRGRLGEGSGVQRWVGIQFVFWIVVL